MEKQTASSRVKTILHILFPIAFVLLFAAILLQWQSHSIAEWFWLAGIGLAFVIHYPYLKARQKAAISTQTTLADSLSIATFVVCLAFLPMIKLATPWFNFADYQLPLAASMLGVALYTAYLVLFLIAHIDLQDSWSPVTDPASKNRLGAQGLYRYTRHPVYASVLLASLAQPLLIQNYIAGGLVVIAYAVMCYIHIPLEENVTIKAFGNAWKNYRQKTGIFFPNF